MVIFEFYVPLPFISRSALIQKTKQNKPHSLGTMWLPSGPAHSGKSGKMLDFSSSRPQDDDLIPVPLPDRPPKVTIWVIRNVTVNSWT